jgi:transcriptional regulator with XRE-family HTH domain
VPAETRSKKSTPFADPRLWVTKEQGGRSNSPRQPKELLDELGLTQAQPATVLGVSSNTIARWERSDMKIENPRLLSLAMAALVGVKARGAIRSSKRAAAKSPAALARGVQEMKLPSGARAVYAKRSIPMPAAAKRSAKRK